MSIMMFSCNFQNCLWQGGMRKCQSTGGTIRQKQDLFRMKSKFLCFQRSKNFMIMLFAVEGNSDLPLVPYPNRSRFLPRLFQWYTFLMSMNHLPGSGD